MEVPVQAAAVQVAVVMVMLMQAAAAMAAPTWRWQWGPCRGGGTAGDMVAVIMLTQMTASMMTLRAAAGMLVMMLT